MKTYTIYFEEVYKIQIDAKNEKQAREKFMTGEYDNPEYLEITGYEIIKEDKWISIVFGLVV